MPKANRSTLLMTMAQLSDLPLARQASIRGALQWCQSAAQPVCDAHQGEWKVYLRARSKNNSGTLIVKFSVSCKFCSCDLSSKRNYHSFLKFAKFWSIRLRHWTWSCMYTEKQLFDRATWQHSLPHASITGVRLPYSTTGRSVSGNKSEMMFLGFKSMARGHQNQNRSKWPHSNSKTDVSSSRTLNHPCWKPSSSCNSYPNHHGAWSKTLEL